MRGTGVVFGGRAGRYERRGPQTGPIRPRRSLRFLSPRSREPPGSHAHRERHAYDADVTVAFASKRQHARADATVRAGGGPRRSTQVRGSLGSEIMIWTRSHSSSHCACIGRACLARSLRSPRSTSPRCCALLSFLARGETPVKYVPNFAEDRWSVVRDFVVGAVAEAATSIAQPADRLIVVAAPFATGSSTSTDTRRRPPSCSTPSSSGDTSPDRRHLVGHHASHVPVGPDAHVRGPRREVPLEFAPTAPPQNTAAPYDDLDLHLLESWATGQSTAARRRSAGVVLALCAGAGLKRTSSSRSAAATSSLTPRVSSSPSRREPGPFRSWPD